MRIHVLKTAPEYFGAVRRKVKRFKLRRNDRAFQWGDLLLLMEFKNNHLTGEQLIVRIVGYLKDVPQYGLKKGYIILYIEYFDEMEAGHQESVKKYLNTIIQK